MLKKTITYKDFDDNDVTKTFFFNLTKAELIEQQMIDGVDDMRELIKALIATKQNKKILDTFKMLLASTVGRREGDRFIKDDETRSEFMDTNAYGELIFEFFTDPNAASDFIRSVVPSDLASKLPAELPRTVEEMDALTPHNHKTSTAKVDTKNPDLYRQLASPTVEPVDFGPNDTGMGEIVSVDHRPSEPVVERKKRLSEYTDEELRTMPFSELQELADRIRGAVPKSVLVIMMQRAAENK